MNIAMTTNLTRREIRQFRLIHIVGVIALAVLILAAFGCSKKSPAPTPTASDASSSGWKLELKVAPDHPRMVKPATFSVHITDSAGKPVDNAQVSGSLNMVLMDMGKTAVKFESRGNGDYEGTVPSFDMSGPWQLTVDAAQGAIHARTVFQVTVLD